MDPLSIGASIIGFLAVSGSCAKHLRRFLVAFAAAPSEILAISNELSDLNVIVQDLDFTHQELTRANQPSAAFEEALRAQLGLAKAKIEILSTVLSQVFTQSASGKGEFHRNIWLLKKAKVAAARAELVEVKRRLILLLASNNASRSARIELRLDKLSTDFSNANTALVSQVGALKNLPGNEENLTPVPIAGTVPSSGGDETGSNLGPGVDTTLLLDMVRQIGKFASVTFHVRRLARCQDKAFGTLFMGYAGLPVFSRDCNIAGCWNQYSRVLQLNYTFPAWFLLKSVDFAMALTYRNEPSFGLKVRNRVQWMGENSIFFMSRNGNKSGIIDLFKQRQASPNDIAAASGQTPIHFALELGHVDTCEFLLDIGVSPFIEDDNGGSDAHEISTLILSKGGARQSERARLYEPLFQKIANSHSELWDFTYVQRVVVGEIAKELNTVLQNPEHIAELDIPDSHGRTALFWAALRGDEISLGILLRCGADHTLADRERRTALHAALISGKLRCVELLIMAGSNVHVRDMYADTALHIATWAVDDPQILEVLFLAGSSLEARNKNNGSALQHAACLNHVKNGTYLLDRGADVNSMDAQGDTVLMETVRFSNIGMLEVLLERGARCDWRNALGQTLLHIAALYANLVAIKTLARYELKGLSAHTADLNGHTANEEFQGRIFKERGLTGAFEQLLVALDELEMNDDSDDDSDEDREFDDALEY